MPRWLLLSAILLTTVGHGSAADLILIWDYPADFTPRPATFLVTYRSSNAPTSPQQFRIPNLGRASCDGVPTAPDLTPDSVCGRPPDCLAPGLYTFWVQAEFPQELSSASNLASCEALPGCTYRCQAVTLPPALQQLATASTGPQGVTPPDPAAVQQVVTTLAQTPTPQPPPSITTAPPTPAQVVDQVQTALTQLPKTPV